VSTWHQPGPPPCELIAEKFQEPLRLAAHEGITLGLENERSTMAAGARRVADFLALVNHPRLRAIWNPDKEQGNADGGGAFPRGYETLKAWIVHVQIKDVKRLPNGTRGRVKEWRLGRR